MSSNKILSLNVRGLRNQVKRRALFAYLKNQKADFYCLQETFSQKLDENTWCQEWGGKFFFAMVLNTQRELAYYRSQILHVS